MPSNEAAGISSWKRDFLDDTAFAAAVIIKKELLDATRNARGTAWDDCLHVTGTTGLVSHEGGERIESIFKLLNSALDFGTPLANIGVVYAVDGFVAHGLKVIKLL